MKAWKASASQRATFASTIAAQLAGVTCRGCAITEPKAGRVTAADAMSLAQVVDSLIDIVASQITRRSGTKKRHNAG